MTIHIGRDFFSITMLHFGVGCRLKHAMQTFLCMAIKVLRFSDGDMVPVDARVHVAQLRRTSVLALARDDHEQLFKG